MIVKFLGVGAIAIFSLIALLLGMPLTIWLLSYIDIAPEQNDCAFGSITKTEYQRLLREARAQDWTVWPGLSNGIFEPSDRGIKQPWRDMERRQGEQLLRYIKLLTVDDSPDAQLAASHAVMRSMGAEYGKAWITPDFRQNGRLVSASLSFDYYLPQARFAPACVPCLLWPNTRFVVGFRQNIVEDVRVLDRVIVTHSNLKNNVERIRPVSSIPCPTFPSLPENN